MTKLRARFAKEHALRFISHLDLARTVERAARRAGVPLAMSQGYHPHPRISFGPALPVGATSDSEYADIELSAMFSAEDFHREMNAVLPEGLAVLEAAAVRAPAESLGGLVEWALYCLGLPGSVSMEDLETGVRDILGAGEIWVEQKAGTGSRKVDARKLIYSVWVDESGERGTGVSSGRFLCAILGAGSKGTFRPEEVAALFPKPLQLHRIHRANLYALERGRLVDPMGRALSVGKKGCDGEGFKTEKREGRRFPIS